jgi:MFS family permease
VGWRAIFWVNVPVVLAAIVLTARFVPDSRAPHPRRPDPVAQVLVVVLLASLVGGVIEGPRAGWTSPLILGLFGLAAVALVGLLAWESRRREPLVELRFFESIPFSSATVTAVCGLAAFGAFLFLSPLFLQEVRGLSPLQAGLMLLPAAATAIVCAPLAGHLVARRGARVPLLIAGAAMAAVALLLATAGPTTPLWLLLVAYALFGVGSGMLNPPITNTAVSGMPRAQAGVAAAVASTSRQVGQALGVAVTGTILVGSAGALGGFTAAWLATTAATLVVLVLAVVATTPSARASAEKVAARFEESVAA